MDNRLANLKKILKEKSLDAALLTSVPDIIYLTNFSHFSDHEREGFLLITSKTNYIITDGRYSHAVKTQIKDFKLLELSGQNNLKNILSNKIQEHNIRNLGIDEHNLTVFEYNKISSALPGNTKTKHFNLSTLRAIKDRTEIEKIQKACVIGDETFSFILQKIKTGITEKQIAFELEIFIRNQNAQLSFPPIIAFEENAAIPHHKTGNRKLNHNEFILLDFGVKFENFCSDMTRTIFFGQANPEQKIAYQTVFDAQQKAIETLNFELLTFNSSNRSIITSKIDNAARTYITSKGFPSIPHSLGHGIGLEVHESPSLSPGSKDILKEGMVFSIEPGIYLPDKYGVRIEDLFVIKDNKLFCMTRSRKNFFEIGVD